jgi:hypothetical protein
MIPIISSINQVLYVTLSSTAGGGIVVLGGVTVIAYLVHKIKKLNKVATEDREQFLKGQQQVGWFI